MGLGKGRMRRGVAMGMLGLPLALAACGGTAGTAPAGDTAPCPRIAILAEGADLTRFRDGGARDLTALTLDARITGFDARCDFAGRDRQELEVRVTPRFAAERGPAAQGATADLPWFVALSDAGDSTVFTRLTDTTRITFQPNVQRATATGRTARLTMPIGGERRAADYVVRLSFQLTPEELALNRQRGPR